MSTTLAPEARRTKAVSMDADLAEWLTEQARRQNRSFSNYMETLLKRHRDEAGDVGAEAAEQEG
jgi:predicted CopG family antitoxin